MKEINSLTKEELLELCIKKKFNGASFLEIANIFKTNETKSDARRYIMSKLEDLDKQQKIQQVKSKHKKKSGLINILIGIGVIIFALILFEQTVIEVFIFGHVVWALGGFLIVRGFINLLSGIKNSN